MTDKPVAAEVCEETAIGMQTETADEAQLTMQIRDLWSTHQEQKVSARRTREELKVIRVQLAEKLHLMKTTLAHTGRGGQWAAFLRSHHLPRATADRLVARHEALLHPQENRTSEAISNSENARKFALRLVPRLRRILRSTDSVCAFYDCLIAEIPAGGFRV